MQAMAMSPEEKIRFDRLERQVETNRERIDSLEDKINTILSIVKGLAWGAAIGIILTLFILGYLTIKDVVGKL